MRIACAQFNPIVGDLKGNSEKILSLIELASKSDVDLIVFPELAVCGYPPEDLLLKEHFVADNIRTLKEIAKKIKTMSAIIGFVDRDKNHHIYNAAAIISKGKIVDIYHKQELPNYGVFDEKRYFDQGQGFNIYSINGEPFGVSICEDIWVEGKVCNQQSKKGAQILINISCSPFDINKLEERERLLSKKAKQTKTYICYVNAVGGQDELVFDGGSFIVDPSGKIIQRAPTCEESLMIADILLKKPSKAKHIISLTWENKQKKRTLVDENYSKVGLIERIYQALVLGTRDYVQKNGFRKVLIGLSGGIDSAVVAAIACQAIGAENVIGVSMPSQFSSQGTKNDAKVLANQLNIEFKEIPISELFQSYLNVLAQEFDGLEPNVAEENLQARIRGTILMALSNKFGHLLLTTGNKTEMAVGYCTLYGDMCGGFSVIKDVPKMMVYQLADFINEGKEQIPESIIKRAPSAELRENQKDQDSLPPYVLLDAVLEEYIVKHSSIDKINKVKNVNFVKKIINLVDQNEYKRRQASPGIKITSRAFGKDWRLPITNKYKEFNKNETL